MEEQARNWERTGVQPEEGQPDPKLGRMNSVTSSAYYRKTDLQIPTKNIWMLKLYRPCDVCVCVCTTNSPFSEISVRTDLCSFRKF